MDEKEIFQKAAELFTDKPTEIEIIPEPKNLLHKILMKLRIKPKSIKYKVKPLLSGNRARIISRAVKFPESPFEKGVLNGLYKLSEDHNEDLLYIAAVAIQNDREEPSAFLIEELRWVEDKVLFRIIDHALGQGDLNHFMKSTILIMGTETMTTMGPKVQKELIASGD